MKKKLLIFLLVFVLISVMALIIGIKHYDIGGQQVPVLLYHHFLSDEELENYDNSEEYAVSDKNFDKQMKYLHDNDYESITLDELYCWKKGKCTIPKKSFVVAIDDGLVSTFKYAKPILKKYGYTATLFTISSRVVKTTEEWDANKLQYIGLDLVESNDKVINIESHSHDFHHMVGSKKAVETMSYEELYKDLKKSKEILSAKYLAYPFNTYNKFAFKSLDENGYLLAFRGTNHKTYRNEYKYMTSRIFINNDFGYFKSIFETDNFNQTLKNKIKSDLLYIKKKVIG